MAREAPIEVIAGKRQFIDFTMTFSSSWSDTEDAGEPITDAKTSGVFFRMKRQKTDPTAAVLSLADEDGGGTDSQIIYVDSPTGKVRVKLGSNTASLEGTYDYELTVKLTSTGDYVSVKQGKITVLPSVTGNPVIP